ncbi:MAG: response regulator transcription factor [Chloroflexi bacterium]|nr:response regulator transcription factor [Chloroflexota bacterium]
MRFLIVDDAEHVRSSLRAVLELETGWRVIADTPDAGTATALALALRPDVVLLDAHLSGVDAIGLARQLKQRAAVVLLTVHDSPALRDQARLHGLDLCLTKSAGVAEVLGALKAAFARPLAVALP